VLRLEVQNHPHVTVLRCAGRIVRGDGADDLLRTVKAQDKRDLQIDLSKVAAIDAGGLGVLVELERWARDTKRTLQLINPTKRVFEALEATGLSSVLQVCPGNTPPRRDDAA
jgi:anti-anti-sigma factor